MKTKSSRSLVAGVNALFRSRESRAPALSRLLYDPYAHLFGEKHLLIWALRGLRFVLPPLRRMIDDLQIAHCVRHSSIDELCLRASQSDQFRQIVLLGAGYDTRSLRLAPRLPGVRWFEADHPATAARKSRLWRRAGVKSNAQHVSLDLEREELAPALASTDFDPTVSTCFVLEGLAHYLSRPTLDRLLSAAAQGPGRRRIVLSYIHRKMGRDAPSLFVALVGLLREVPMTHFDREELTEIGQQCGLTVTGHWTFAEQAQHLLPAPPQHAPTLSQNVATLEALGGSVTPASSNK